MDFTHIQLAHGGGGELSHQLTRDVFLSQLSNTALDKLNDSAVLKSTDQNLAFTTDSFVVDPIFFPGGDIGRLAVCGTVNDLAMMGAVPRYLSIAFILEEGLPVDDLKSIVASIRKTADEAGVAIVTGDTKVVPRGHCDKVFINTAGIGFVRVDLPAAKSRAAAGDVIIVSGPLGSHGMAVMTSREELGFTSTILSDVAPLNHLVQSMLGASENIHVMRDATRGGLATVLNEIADQSSLGIEIDETAVPVNDDVRGGCELLGFDPLYVANEGVLVASLPEEEAEAVIEQMRQHEYGKHAAIIGRVSSSDRGRVVLQTAIGSRRILDMMSGEQLPRIC